MNRWQKAGLGLVVLLVGMQLVPVHRTNPPVRQEVQAPPKVAAILRKSCYDCHSNQTVWPWYSHVAPASWKLVADVDEAREKLNFTEWDGFDADEREEFQEVVRSGEMPLKLYLLAHPAARPTEAERQTLLEWATRPEGDGRGR